MVASRRQPLLLPPSTAEQARARSGRLVRRLVFTVRKTLWFWFYIGAWTWPQTHWRKWGELERWLETAE